jgi:hypothetical protein
LAAVVYQVVCSAGGFDSNFDSSLAGGLADSQKRIS